MLTQAIVAFCIIDDALKALGHRDDPQAKVPTSVILTLAILASLELGGKHAKALALAKELHLFSHVPSPSRFKRRLHRAKPNLLPLLHLLSPVWQKHHTAHSKALDTFPIPVCENIRAPRSRLAPDGVYRGYIPSTRTFFHGYKLHLLVDDGRFICEVNLSPGSFHDLTSFLLLPLDIHEGLEVYLERGYTSSLFEVLL
ncbi:MAG: transposase [Thermus sp.]|nr:transposase [Thermus sp.]